jgi:hypothetical protein
MFLREDEGDAVYRLAWTDAESERPRAIPAGTYRVVGYRIQRVDENGTPWHLSATGNSIAKLTLTPGATGQVDIDATVHVKKRFHAGRVAMAITGQKAGLTIYKEGKRIPVRFRLADGEGTELAAGKMNYG